MAVLSYLIVVKASGKYRLFVQKCTVSVHLSLTKDVLVQEFESTGLTG
jgi:hypothetical protein